MAHRYVPRSPMRPTLLLAATSLVGTSTAFTAQPVHTARRLCASPPMRLSASHQQQDEEFGARPHDQDIAESLSRERYLRAVECSKTDGLCDVEELDILSSEFDQVFDDDIPYSQEFEQHIADDVHNMHSDLKSRMKELNIKVNKITSDYRQANKDDWEQYLGGIYGSSGLSS